LNPPSILGPHNVSKRCLTIGGSDCSGGAGIEADLAIFRDAGLKGCNVITALTAQTTHTIHRIEATPCPQIKATIAAVSELGAVKAIKTGMLVDQARVEAVAEGIACYFSGVPLVVDPVLIASSGKRLLSDDGLATLCKTVFPLATIITPNLDEAAVLLGKAVADHKSAAILLAQQFDCAVLLKGGHGTDTNITETLAFANGDVQQWQFSRQALTTERAHGTGCRTAAAIAAAIALCLPLAEAIPIAHQTAIDGCWQHH